MAKAESSKAICAPFLPNLKEFCLNPTFSDATINVMANKFQINKTILAANSKYFWNIFFSPFQPDKKDYSIDLNITKETFTLIIQFCYGFSVVINDKNCEEIYNAGKVLNLKPLWLSAIEMLAKISSPAKRLKFLRTVCECAPEISMEENGIYKKYICEACKLKDFSPYLQEFVDDDIATLIQLPCMKGNQIECFETAINWIKTRPTSKAKTENFY